MGGFQKKLIIPFKNNQWWWSNGFSKKSFVTYLSIIVNFLSKWRFKKQFFEILNIIKVYIMNFYLIFNFLNIYTGLIFMSIESESKLDIITCDAGSTFYRY